MATTIADKENNDKAKLMWCRSTKDGFERVRKCVFSLL